MKRKLLFFPVVLIVMFVFSSCSKSHEQIHVISREDGSGTRGAFVDLFDILYKNDDIIKDYTTKEAIIINKTDVMLSNVSNDPDAIGYISYGSINTNVKAMAIEGVAPTAKNMQNRNYDIVRPFNIVTLEEKNHLINDFIAFIFSSNGQNIIANDYIKFSEQSESFESIFPKGKIVITGSSSVNPVMEKLVEEYLKINDKAHIEILVNDSSTGIQNTLDGNGDIGMVSRDLDENEAQNLKVNTIALDGILVIVNPANPINSLTKEQVRSIFTGEVTSWSEIIGGFND